MRYQLQTRFLLLLFIQFVCFPFTASSAPDEGTNSTNQVTWNNLSSSEVPTVITSDAMVLRNEEKTFTYTGNVVMDKGDFRMTSNRLEGKYNEDQGIDELQAFEDVVITKGPTIRARSNKAVYDKATETMVLTDNPEVTEEQSILTADLVRIFLKENRSTAEGNVRVKLIQKDGQ